MAKFEIVSVGASGQYTVKELIDVAGLSARIAALQAKNTDMVTRNAEIDALLPALNAEADSVEASVETLMLLDPPDLVGAQEQRTYGFTVSTSIGRLTRERNRNELEIEANIKTIARIQSVIDQGVVVHDAVCVDGNDSLTVGQVVGSMDFHRYPASKSGGFKVRILPGGDAPYVGSRDGVTRHAVSMGASELFVNQALMGAAQAYIPRYLPAQITSLDTDNNLASVTLLQQSNNHPVTWWEGAGALRMPASSLSNIPVVYRSCHAAAFEVGDTVVVRYQSGVAKVVGFMDNPSLCVSVLLSGTVMASITEADIVAGGKTLIITLTDDVWVAVGAAFDAVRADIIAGLDSAQAEATGWDAEVVPAIPVGNVVRTSDTVVTITLPAVAGYDITATETISATVPAEAMVGAAVPVLSDNSFSIDTASGGFLAVATPINFISACGIEVNAAFEVDWGDGIFIGYAAGRVDVVPSGAITVRSSSGPTWFRFHTNTFSAIDVQQSSSISSLAQSFYNLPSLSSVGIADASSVVTMASAFLFCSGLSSFPAIDTSSCLNMSSAWYGCSGLTSFPLIDTSSCTNFDSAWRLCTGLTSFPSLDTSSGLDFDSTWRECSGLTSFPSLDVSTGTTFASTWFKCTGLTAFPALDMSSATYMTSTWRECTGLTSFPSMNFALTTRLDTCWVFCSNLVTIGTIYAPLCTNYTSTFSFCTSLTNMPMADVSAGVFFVSMFYGSTSLTYMPHMDTSSGQYFQGMFQNCSSLSCLTSLNTLSQIFTTNMFTGSIITNPNTAEKNALLVGANYVNAGSCP